MKKRQQKNLINFELYDTYTEVEFIDLLNKMPLVPLLLTIKNVNVNSPLMIEKDDLNFGYLCKNFNIQLDVRIQTDTNISDTICVRDNFFYSRRDLLLTQDGYVPFNKYIFLPNINMYNRIQNIAENIVHNVLDDSYIVLKVNQVDGKNIKKVISDFPLNYQIFQLQPESNQLKNQVLRLFDLPEVLNMTSEKQLLNKIEKELPPKILSLIIVAEKIQSDYQREIIQRPLITAFCRYTFNTQKHEIFLPVVDYENQESKAIVLHQSYPGYSYQVDENELKTIRNINIVNKFASSYAILYQK